MKSILQAIALVLLLSLDCEGQSSPDGTTVPPAPAITIYTNPTNWTLGAPSAAYPGNYDIMKDGVNVLGARGSKIALCKGIIYVLGRDKLWWRYAVSYWQTTGSATLPCSTPASKNFTLNWTPGPIGANNTPTTFNVYKNGVAVAAVNYPVTTYTDPVATPSGQSACYQVSAVDAAGESAKSTQACGNAP